MYYQGAKSRFSTFHKQKHMLVGLRSSQHFLVLSGAPGCSTSHHTALRVFQTISDPLHFFSNEPQNQRFVQIFSDIFESLWCNAISLYARLVASFYGWYRVVTELHESFFSLESEDQRRSYRESAFLLMCYNFFIFQPLFFIYAHVLFLLLLRVFQRRFVLSFSLLFSATLVIRQPANWHLNMFLNVEHKKRSRNRRTSILRRSVTRF